jgi:NarL family two-component system response regulator LiaR
MSAEPVTVFIVDDHALIRQGVRAYLETQPGIVVVGEAGDGHEAVRLAAELVPDVVLMDLVLPGLDGVESTREIKRATPGTHVIILTSYHEDEHILPAMRAGALSYLIKDISPAELVEAIRKAARGEVVLSSRVASQILRSLGGNDSDTHGPMADLSDRELEVLRVVAEGAPNSAIAERLFISEKTVKSHVRNILSKLQVADRTQAAVYAWRNGLVSRDKT